MGTKIQKPPRMKPHAAFGIKDMGGAVGGPEGWAKIDPIWYKSGSVSGHKINPAPKNKITR